MYLDVTVGDVLAVGELEALKDGLEDVTDLFFPHVDAIRVRVQIGLGQLHHKVELGGSLDDAEQLADTRLFETNGKQIQ